MKIGIIGAGNIGSTLARKLMAAGHAVKLTGTKGSDDIRGQAQKIGATAVASGEAVKDVGIIVLSIPFASIPEVDEGRTESLWSSEQLVRPVVKTFNAALAKPLADGSKPVSAADRLAIPVSGDTQLPRGSRRNWSMMRGRFARREGLDGSWRPQPGTLAYCTN